MKNFRNFMPDKYNSSRYQKVKNGIYITKNPFSLNNEEEIIYVSSLAFEHEPELYGESEGSPQNIAQIPFEALLDEFCLFVTDFYDELNGTSSSFCYTELGSGELENMQKLQSVIGKRVYAKPFTGNGKEYYNLIIE